MLHKSSRPGYKRVIKKTALWLIAAEAIGFGVTYAGWYRLNTNRDFRHYVKENYPTILESYYQLGEFLGGDSAIRSLDEQIWVQQRAVGESGTKS
ncbi:protein CEBPZOS [Armigeres subalbatus]|uniref:protein CEBPZOS n=1 Tax=Armigeres subalbatus TaxID=124917 RepID=UPI002ED0B149